MACFTPLAAVRGKDGKIRFHWRATGKQMQLPCGRCIGCKLERSRQWALRCVHEARGHEENSWLTLTYDDDNLPYGGSLVKPHLQKFYKRLRKEIEPIKIRYFSAGEYGEDKGRPHYHICLFGFDFPDKHMYRVGDSGEDLYTSELLDRLWGKGRSEIGEVTFESAAYTARYCTKKITGDMAKDHYTVILLDGRMVEIEPEFAMMSLGRNRGDGIGAKHFDKYRDEIYPEDECVIRGKRSKPPRYYDKLLEETDVDLYEEVKRNREDFAEMRKSEETLSRRTQRRIVKEAQVSQLIRPLEKR